MQIFVHSNCEHSSNLLKWMLENIPEQEHSNFELIYATSKDNVKHVPCILSFGEKCIGFRECVSHLKNLQQAEKGHVKSGTVHSKGHIVDDEVPSKFKDPVEKQSVEDRFNDLVSARKPAPPAHASQQLLLPERAVPSL